MDMASERTTNNGVVSVTDTRNNTLLRIAFGSLLLACISLLVLVFLVSIDHNYRTFQWLSEESPKAVTAMGSVEMKKEDFEFLKTIPGNDTCVDCGKNKPDWGSPKLGILFCFECSGKHRGLGTHISFVRSVTMDNWTDQQIKLMKAGGNKQCNDFLKEHKVPEKATVREKYDCPAAELYRQVLKARVEGKPEPTELPKKKEPVANSIKGKKMEGFGSSAPPPPPEPARKKKRVLRVLLAVAAVAVVAAGVVCLILFL